MTQGELGRYPVSVDIPVAWGEMDAYGHVNNAVYLRWFETARMAYFGGTGVEDRKATDGVGPILARATVDYRRPITFPDTVRVEVTVTRLGRSSFTMAYRLHSRALGALAAEGESVVVMVDYRSGSTVALDEGLRRRILELEASGSRQELEPGI